MKPIDDLTAAQVSQIVEVLMDSERQSFLLDNPTNPDSWMLDFVFDSRLRDQLMRYAEKKSMEQ